MTWIIFKVISIPTHCSVAYESVLSLAQCLRLRCRMLRRYQKRSKKLISTSNFETSSHRNVTAKKAIHNMYFMYVDMAWFHSLSRLEHDILHSVTCASNMPNVYVLAALSDSHEKNVFFCLSFPECYPYNRNLWFLLKNRSCFHKCQPAEAYSVNDTCWTIVFIQSCTQGYVHHYLYCMINMYWVCGTVLQWLGRYVNVKCEAKLG